MTRINGYQTKQRDEILSFFERNADRCISAKELIGESGLSAGEATVYRTLAKFVREGRLRKFVKQDSEGTYYQYNPDHLAHDCFHLQCIGCGKQIRLECGFAQDMSQHIRAEHAFAVDCGRTVIYGQCEECRKSL